MEKCKEGSVFLCTNNKLKTTRASGLIKAFLKLFHVSVFSSIKAAHVSNHYSLVRV